MTALTFEDAKERLGKLAGERPDFVYQQVPKSDPEEPEFSWTECAYFDANGAPSCIVGHAYADELRSLAVIEGLSAHTLLGELGADPKAQELAREVQTAQDRGVPWGQAYTEALERVERRIAAGV